MVSRSRRSGLLLPVTRVTLRARRLALGKRFTSTSGVAITAALQCFVEDLLNAAADAAAHEGRKRIHIEDVVTGLDLSLCGRVVSAPIVNSIQPVKGVARTVQLSEGTVDDIKSKYQAKARERLEVAAAKVKAKTSKVAKVKTTKTIAKSVKVGKKRPVEEEEEDEATTNGSAELEEEEEEEDEQEEDEFD